jgi:hypothetical protein
MLLIQQSDVLIRVNYRLAVEATELFIFSNYQLSVTSGSHGSLTAPLPSSAYFLHHNFSLSFYRHKKDERTKPGDLATK